MRADRNDSRKEQISQERDRPETLTVPLSGSDSTKDSNAAIEVPGTVFKVHSRGVAEVELEELVEVAVFEPTLTPTALDLLDELEATRGLWMIRIIAAAAIPPRLSAPTR